MDKKGLIEIGRGVLGVILILSLFTIISLSGQTSAGKADQYFIENKTCEQFTDSILWSVAASKADPVSKYYNWTIGEDSPGPKDKDIISIWTYARYINLFGGDAANLGNAYARLANTTESDLGTYSRYPAYLNATLLGGETLGPRWECGINAASLPTTCDTTSQGYDNATKNYSVHLFANSEGNNKAYHLIDLFNIRYDWCWIPLIYDVNVSQESGGWGSTWNFTIKVTNPEVNTTVKLWRRQIGQEWEQIGSEQNCIDCANITLNWTTEFVCSGNIGEWEFKFNATDNESYSAEAGDSLTTGGVDECLDNENDCVFEITANQINYTIVGVDYYEGGTVTLDNNATLKIQAYDVTKGSSDIGADSLFVDFKVEKSAGGNDFQTLSPASTANTTGYAEFVFTPTVPPFSTGDSKWFVSTSATTACYVVNQSGNSTVSIQVTEAPTPVFVNETVNGVTSGASAGWGSNWTYSVNVSNPASGEGDINLTLQVNTGSGFTDIETKVCTAPCLDSTKFTFFIDNFTCLTPPTASEYKFKASNLNGTDYTSARSFTMAKDNIIFEYIQGNNSIANRSGSQIDLLILRINDTDKGEYISNGTNATFYVEYNDIAFDSGTINQTNSSGHVSYYFEPTCSATKYLAGDRDWKASVLSTAQCYQAVTSDTYNLSIRGDISLDFTNPTGTSNYTQEGTINFLGATTDDCGDALEATVIYNANISAASGFACDNTTQVGANAFTCDYETTTATTNGFYNLTMFANYSYHYDNFTVKENNPGLFYLSPLRRLSGNNVTPSSEYYYYDNWNFTVNATSGDDTVMRIELYLKKGSGGFGECSGLSTCENQTLTICTNCQNQEIYWYKNFTQLDAGTWFYQIRMINNGTEAIETQTAGTDSFSVNDIEAENIIFIDEVQSPSSAQWGGSDFSFSVAVNTSSDYNLTVALWYGPSVSGPWTMLNETNWTNPPGGFQNFNTTVQFDCDDVGTNYYFFNASDGAGTTNLTTSQIFNVTKDYINLDYVLGDGEDANRSSSQSSPLVFYAENANGTTMLSFPIKYTITTNNLSEYSDDNFIINTNSTGYANFNFNATCTDDYSGAPKFLVGEQQWKVSVNDSELTCYYQNDSSNYQSRNLFVQGDIQLDFTNPTGTANYTQEDTISFLGATTDDCGDALEATVIYNANISAASGFACDNTTLVGANAFTCDYETTTATTNGFYNLTMFANYSYHYDNNTVKENNPGLFYLEPLRRLSGNNVTPSADYYDHSNWNFTVNATSGDNQQMNITLFLKKGSGGFSECGSSATCENITATICTNCQNQLVYWHKNFTQSDAGTWFYQIRMINNLTGVIETQTAGTDSFSVNDYTQESIVFEDELQNPSSAQWGGSDFNFSVTVNTSSTSNLTVYLWYGPSVSGPWTLLNQTNWTNPPAGFQSFNTTTQFDCSDIGTNYYFFNATDFAGANNLTTPQAFNVTKDYVYLDYVAGDGEDANRSSSQTSPLVFYAENANTTVMASFPIKYTITTNNLSEYSDDNFIIETNSTGQSSLDFDASCTDDYTGAPKFLVGEQQWRVGLNDSELICYYQNDSSNYQSRNLFVQGDISLDFTNPTGTSNYTQEDTISFLGATTDDCGDALEATVIYNANISAASGFACDNTTLVGANAFTCDYVTTTATTNGFYNLTMFANYSYHYDNNTVKENNPGLFYLEPLRRLSGNNVTPDSEYYYYENWNFTVNATSGDDTVMRIELYLKKGGGGFGECSGLSTCENMTLATCTNCQNQEIYWYKNFTQEDAGTWFYQIKMINNETEAIETQTAGTDSFAVNDVTPESITFVNITQNPSSAQWGGTTVTYNVTVNTSVSNNLTVYAWNSLSETGPWDLVDTEIYDNATGGWQTLNYSKQTDSSDIGTNYYFFNASDGEGATNTTAINSYTITKDAINMNYLAGDGETANRSGDQITLLSFQAVNANETIMENFPIKYSVTSNNVTYYTDDYFIINTNSTGYANFNFNATCTGEYSGAPKFLVDEQQWKAELNDSLLDYYFQNDTSGFLSTNIFVYGDISLDFTNPSGAQNFTQEQIITYLGATTDDCGDALEATVVYDSNSSENNFQCSNTTQIGANAFQCFFQTYLNTTRGYYNATMNANFTFHYDNSTSNTENPGLFYILPKKKLENPQGNSSSGATTDGWGSFNWNFSVAASSGDPDNNLTVGLYMGQTVNPTTECVGPTCLNQTTTSCNDCEDKSISWLRNFTSSDIGTWYYQFKLDDAEVTSTSGTDYSVVVRKDVTNISYGDSGNNSNVEKDGTTATLKVRVFDIDKDSFNVTVPSATVTFKLLHSGYDGDEKIIGTNVTNSSGYAEYYFNVTDCDYIEGAQKWVGEINSSESNYNESISENFTITLSLPGCEATVDVYSVAAPSEVFQNKNFTTNGTVTAWITSADNVSAVLNSTEAWTIYNQIQFLETVTVGAYDTVTWIVNPTSYGNFNLSLYANSSNAGNDTEYSSVFEVYKEFAETNALESLPSVLGSNEEKIFSWNCNVSNYRIGSLRPSWNSTGTTIRVESYDGLNWNDILHSEYVGTDYAIESPEIAVLSEQIFSNESGYCTVRVSNIGDSDINISGMTLENYYEEDVRIQDVAAKVGSFELTGIETTDVLVNFTVKVGNSLDSAKSLSVTLNVTNSTGSVVNSSVNSSVNVGANSEVDVEFLNVNTSTWSSGEYSLNVYVSGDEADSRVENLTFKDVGIYGRLDDYMCNGTTEEYTATVYHPFGDSIDYNVSLEVPSGWSYSGEQWINATAAGNYSVTFNVTSGQNVELVDVNASIEYTYPTVKSRKAQESTENNNSVAILEVVRETLKEVGNYTEFYSRLAVYNKGCATASDISFTETTSTGWTAYGQTLDGSSAGITDIPGGEISFSSSDFGTINEGDYKIIEYKILSDVDQFAAGTLRYNLTWGSKNEYEYEDFEISTMRYSEESHLVFDIQAVESYKERSAEPNEYQVYNLTAINVGDLNIGNLTWNVTLSIPSDCEVANISDSGSFGSGEIVWQLGILNVSQNKIFNFTMNCSTEGKKVLTAKGINDTIIIVSSTINTTIGCSGQSCNNISSFAFTKPSDAKYEKLTEADFYIGYDWTDYGLTIGEGYVNFSGDYGNEKIVWQNYSFSNADGSVWANYTINASSQDLFQNETRDIGVRSYVGGISEDAFGNVTIEKIAYVWQTGRAFNDNQSLFVNVKPYTFVPTAPVLKSPENGSDQFSLPIVFSWEEQSAPSGINITYYIYGDNETGTAFLGATTDAFYLWRNIESDIYYWKVKAVTSEGQNSSMSETWQFDLDLCTPDADYEDALDFPMSYDSVSDTITVWGSNGTDGYTVMGSNSSNPITFEHIYNFSKAVRGICAMTNPATGAYAILTRLEIGNTSSLLNTTFARTTGESVDFGKQVQLKFNATFTSGELTEGGIAQTGSTLSFSGTDATDSGEGQFFLLDGSKLELYDTGVLHKTSATNSNPFRLYWNGDVTAKSSTLQNWWTIRFLGDDNNLDSVNIINMGEGFYPATTQIGTLDTINPGNVETGGLMLTYDSNVTITALEVSEASGDILIINYTGVANLINPTLNWSNLNWTTGSFAGQINRKYDYDLTTVSGGSALENVSVIMLDLRGDELFSLDTDSDGEIVSQTITRAIYDYDYKAGDERGPHTLKLKKYGKTFTSPSKEFSAKTIETIPLDSNPFATLTESQVLDLTGIYYNAPGEVNYGDEINSSWSLNGTLNNSPVVQSEFFSLFANGTKLTEGAGNNFTIDYETGEITFVQDVSGYDVYPVYSYGGDITIATGTASTDCISMSDLYSYMQYNLSDVLATVDGTAYTSYVDLIIGNSTVGGCIIDSSASISFEEGYTYSFSSVGGYLDLYGITTGGGAGGGLPLNIFDDVGTSYEPGDTVYIFSTTLDSDGTLVSSAVNVTVYYSNGTLLNSGLSTETSTGRFRYNFTLSGSAPEGTYRVDIDATYSGNSVSDSLAFVAAIAGGGAANPEVAVEAPSAININTNFDIITLAKSAAGIAVNCDSTPNITIRDTLLNSVIVSNAGMTNFATGQYNYTWSAENQSTFLATVVCTISGIDYTGITTFSTEGVPITGGNIVELKGFDEVVADSQYKTKLWIFDVNGNPINADSIPTVTLYDAGENTIVDSVSMTQESTGVYSYNYTTSSGQIEGDWETRVNVTVNGITSYPSEFWDLVGGIFDVRNIVVDNSAVSSLQISVTTENMGGVAKDLFLQWNLTRADNGQQLDAGMDTFAVGAESIKGWTIYPTTSYVGPVKILFLGTYSGTEKAGAYEYFTTTTTAPPEEPSDGGGGGGGVSIITPRVIEEKPEEKPYIFDISVRILPKYLEVFAGDTVAAEIIIQSLGTVKEASNVKLEYFIEDSEENIIVSIQELIDINEETKFLKELGLPKKIKNGKYKFVVKLEYEGVEVIGEQKFKIVEEGKLISATCCFGDVCGFKFIFCWYWWALIVIIISAVAGYTIRNKRKTRPERKGKLRTLIGYIKNRSRKIRPVKIRKVKLRRRQEGEDLNKLIRYIRNG